MTSIASCTPNKPLLVLNTAESRVQFAVGTRDRLLFAQQTEIQARTMQILPPAVQSCLGRLHLQVSDLDRVVVVRGPGTFTGIRVGMAFALGLARGGQVPLAGLDYLPLLAQAPGGLLQGTLWVCTHARQNLVNAQAFAVPQLRCLSPARCQTREEAVETMQAGTGKVYVLGSGLRRDLDWWSSRLQISFLDPVWDVPKPDDLVQAAWEASCGLKHIFPSYLRPSDAELQLERIARDRGVDPHAVRQAIPAFETDPGQRQNLPGDG
ncbi:MAG: tRNA (adenosine(37)-N6)-threonylcarbamoyltransferase complex dimerization subunit type 1 TsaB [Desulfovermiculus sp.]|nr:tRNA (adenosine(37)-N6)-threonylcarbamoyltransferase complex dimerization subunit type 1 TsaB [Desulfovermiculus sp.]